MSSLLRKQLQIAMEITNNFLDDELFVLFKRPVDLEKFPDYKSEIENPKDLETIKYNLQNEKYNDIKKWKYDMNTMFENSLIYNKDDDFILVLTNICQKIFMKEYDKIKSTTVRGLSKIFIRYMDKLQILLANPPKGICNYPKENLYYTSTMSKSIPADDIRLSKALEIDDPAKILQLNQVLLSLGASLCKSENGVFEYDYIPSTARRYIVENFYHKE